MEQKYFRNMPLNKDEYFLLNKLATAQPGYYEKSINEKNYQEYLINFNFYKNIFPNDIFIRLLDKKYIKYLTNDNPNDYFNSSLYNLKYSKPVFIYYDYESETHLYDYESVFQNWSELFQYAKENVDEIIKFAQTFSKDFELDAFLSESKYFSMYEGKINYIGSATSIAWIIHKLYYVEGIVIKESEIEEYINFIELVNRKPININTVYTKCNGMKQKDIIKEPKDLKNLILEYKKIKEILKIT